MITQYSEEVNGICKEIEMPEEVTKKIREEINETDFFSLENDFTGLFQLETGGDAAKNIPAKLKITPDSFKPLAVYLAAAAKAWEQYELLGIHREIFIDTMKMFTRFVREHKETFGFYGFDRDFWIYRALSCKIFRLGALEFEMTTCRDNELLAGYAKEGDKIISVHIPSDSVMTRENLDDSYNQAKAFFNQFYPEYENSVINCGTWLLDPGLKSLLPSKSRILNFQSDYKILTVTPGDKSYMIWVFKRKYEDYALLPENTTLQRNIKQHLLSGGDMSLARGIYRGACL